MSNIAATTRKRLPTPLNISIIQKTINLIYDPTDRLVCHQQCYDINITRTYNINVYCDDQ